MRAKPAPGLAKSLGISSGQSGRRKSGVAIAPLQDLLNLGVEGRMNVPGVATGQLALALHGGDAQALSLRAAA